MNKVFSFAVHFLVTSLVMGNTSPVVSNVTASQRTDGSKLVDIRYDLFDADNDTCMVTLQASSDDGSTWPVHAVTFLPNSAIGSGVQPGNGKLIIWDVDKDLPEMFGNNYRIKLTADDGGATVVLNASGEGYQRVDFTDGTWQDIDYQYEVSMSLIVLFRECQNDTMVYRIVGKDGTVRFHGTAQDPYYGYTEIFDNTKSYAISEDNGGILEYSLIDNRVVFADFNLPRSADEKWVSKGILYSAYTRPHFTRLTIQQPSDWYFDDEFDGCNQSYWIDFRYSQLSGANVGLEYNSGFQHNDYYGDSWLMATKGAEFQITFDLNTIPNNLELVMRHLTSANGACTGSGYAPTNVVINGTPFLTCYDPAEHHNGTHGFVTDRWDISDFVHVGNNIMAVMYCANVCSPYWIKYLFIESEGDDCGIVSCTMGYELSNMFTIDNRTSCNGFCISLISTYSGVFPEGVEIINTITATVAWSGKTPSKVIFSMNGLQKEVNTTTNKTQTTYNMGQDLIYSKSGAKNELLVWAVATDGTISKTSKLNFSGLKLPSWSLAFSDKHKGKYTGVAWKFDPLTGKVTFFGEVELLKERPGGTVSIPKSIPEVGGEYGVKINPLTCEWELSAQPRFGDGSGLTGSFDLSGTWGASAKCGTKREFDLSASIAGTGELYPSFRLKEISAELAGAFEFKFPRVPLLCTWTPPCCHTGYCPYFQASLKPEISGTISMEEREPSQFLGLKFKDAELEMELTLAGTVGAGSEGSIYYIAGTFGGKPSVIIQFPSNTDNYCMNEYIKQVAFDFDVKFTSECAWWKKEWSNEFNLYTCPKTGAPIPTPPAPCKEGSRITVVDRTYLNDPVGYCVFSQQPKQLKDTIIPPTVGGFPAPILNVGSMPTPSIAASTDHGLIAFVYDDAGKPTGKHQEIYYARWNGSQWTNHAPLTNNLNPDIQPVAQIDSVGNELIVWVTGPEPTGAETGPRDILPSLEIQCSRYNPGLGVWEAPKKITHNYYVDLLPWFNTKSDRSLRVCWISSPTNAIPVWHDEEIVPRLDVMASDWDGQSFGVPYPIVSDLVAVSPPSIVQDANHEYLAYLKDMDNNSGTAEDREVYVRKRVLGGVWEEDQRLTNDMISDSAAQLVMNDAGVPMLVWVKRMVPIETGDPDQNTHVDQLWFSEFNQGNWTVPTPAFEYDGITEPKLYRNTVGKVFLFWVAASKEFSDIYYSVYDAERMQWGYPQQITQDQGAETMISLAESGGDILASYVKRRIDLSDPYKPPVTGLSDIYMMRHNPTTDLSVNGDGISFDPTPVPGEDSRIIVKIHLSGDSVISDVKVQIYDGNPSLGGTQIDTHQIAEMLPGQIMTVSSMWHVPDDGLAHPVYVVVDPENTIPETDDFGNNTALLQPLMVNLVAQKPQAMGYPSANKVIIGVAIKNSGSMNSGSFSCEVRQGDVQGPILFSTMFKNISSGQVVNTQFEWDLAPVVSGIHNLVVIADPLNAVTESQKNDNISTGPISVLPDLLIEPGSAQLVGTTISVIIRNVGAKPSTPSLVRVSFNEHPIGETAIPALNPSDSMAVAIPLSPTIKFGRIVITVNPDVSDEDEVTLRNNMESFTRFAPGDFDMDGDVGVTDLSVLAAQWLDKPGIPSADIAPEPLDQYVDIKDFALFAEYWLTFYGR